MIARDAAAPLLGKVLARARAAKAEAVVSLDASRGGNTRFARGTITSSADVERVTLAVAVQLGRRSATATTNQLTDPALDDVVARAVAMAKLAPENPEQMPPLPAQHYVTAHALDRATAALSPADRAKAVAAALAGGGALATGLAGFYDHQATLTARATSAGLVAAHEATYAGFSCTARTPDGTGSGWAGTQSNRASDFDPGALAHLAAEKATASAHPKRLEPGRYTVVLEPAAVSSLLEFLIASLDARRADEGRSFFTRPGGGTRIGEQLFPDTIRLSSDPADPQTGGAPFDGEGAALAPRAWLDKGTLTALTYSRYWAKQHAKPATGAPNGWTLAGGNATRQALIKDVARGVLVTRFWYLREVDPQAVLVTGLTRDGTFLIERGEIVGPVNNFRFNESPVQMLETCDGLGAGSITAGEGAWMRAPTLRCHEFNLASISEAV